MPDDDEVDIVGGNLARRLRGGPTSSPLNLPGVEGRQEFRELFERISPGSASAEPPANSKLPPAQQAIVEALFDRFIKWTRNTNFTASEPAHAQPMLWSDPLDLTETYTLPAAASPTYTPVIQYTVPPGRWARISAYAADAAAGFTYDDSILWQITVNSLAVPSLNGWGEHRGTIAIPRDTFILVPENQTVSFNIRRAVAAGGTTDVVMSLQGWLWRLRKDFEGTKASVTAY